MTTVLNLSLVSKKGCPVILTELLCSHFTSNLTTTRNLQNNGRWGFDSPCPPLQILLWQQTYVDILKIYLPLQTKPNIELLINDD